MKKTLLPRLTFLVFFAFTIINLNAQIRFENGYYIDNNEQKIEGLIEDKGWIKPPEEIRYKSSENAEVKTLDAEEISEFSINEGTKYIAQTAKIDTSYFKGVRILDESAEPKYEEKRRFLKVLVEGQASLLEYFNGNYTQYYLKVKNSKNIPLIYKRYRPKRYKSPSGEYVNWKIFENKTYQRQLYNKLQCNNLTQKDFERLDYKKKVYPKYFRSTISAQINIEKQKCTTKLI